MNENSVLKEFFTEIEDIKFTSVDDLYERKDEICENFQTKSSEVKIIYKWYFFFQLCLLKDPLKSLLWDYLNGFRETYVILNLSLEYRKLCNRRKQIKKEEILEEDTF